MRYDLECRYDSRQNFYGKAKVEQDAKIQDNMLYNIYKLYSYGTLVARITENTETNKATCEYLGKYSQTTTRHQKEFFKQYGLSEKEIKELWKNGAIEV